MGACMQLKPRNALCQPHHAHEHKTPQTLAQSDIKTSRLQSIVRATWETRSASLPGAQDQKTPPFSVLFQKAPSAGYVTALHLRTEHRRTEHRRKPHRWKHCQNDPRWLPSVCGRAISPKLEACPGPALGGQCESDVGRSPRMHVSCLPMQNCIHLGARPHQE